MAVGGYMKKKIIIGLIVLVGILLCVKVYDLWYFSRDMMLEPRLSPSITLLKDETVLITGGTSGWKVLDSAEIYDPKTHKSHYVGKLNIRRSHHKAILLDDGRVLIVGGMTPGIYTNLKQAEIYDPKTKKFKLTDISKTDTKNGNEYLVKLKDGKIFILGRKQVEVFDPKTENFTLIGETIGNQDDSSASILPDGNLIILGVSYQKLNEKIYNSIKEASLDPKFPFKTIYLPNRRYFSVNKFGNKFKKELCQENTSEVYYVKANKVIVGPRMHVQERRAIRPVVLEDGRILVAGGEDTSARPVSELEVYNPKTNKFKYIGKILNSRKWITPVKLNNGLIYIIGGNYTNRSSFLASNDKPTCELFNPKTNEFKMTKICTKELKYDYVPILLKDGRLLILGGNRPIISDKLRRKIEIINTKEIE